MLYRRKCLFRMLYLIPIICLLIIFIVLFIIYYHPRFAIYFLSKYHPDVLFHVDVPSNVRYVALTIDDFPNPLDLSISFRILDMLRTFNARCTFFLIGSHVIKYQDSPEIQRLFERLLADGHELGNHGWRDEKAIHLSEQELEEQIKQTQEIIEKYTNSSEKKWFRPGSGFFNQTMIQLCTRLGYRLVLGSIYPHDPQMPHPKLNAHFIQLKLYPGAIIILHDRIATIETLQRVLPIIQRQNLQVVTLTELNDMKTRSADPF